MVVKRAEVAKLPYHERIYGDPDVWYFDSFDQPLGPEAAATPIQQRPYAYEHEPIGGGRFPTHAAALAHAIQEVGLAPCECELLPEKYHTTHYGATEPGSMYQFNPDCPAHGYEVAEAGLTPTNPYREKED